MYRFWKPICICSTWRTDDIYYFQNYLL